MTLHADVHDRPTGAPFGDWVELLRRPDGPDVLAIIEATLDEQAQLLLVQLLECVARIAELTDLPEKGVLERAGCRATDRLDRLSYDLLGRCYDFMLWIEDTARALDHVDDRRRVLVGAATLLADADGDVEVFVAAASAGEWNCLELLRLGELEGAWHTARLHLPTGAGDHEREHTTDAGAPHIGDHRLRLLEQDPAALGPTVGSRMREHVELCPACAAAFVAATFPRVA